MLCQSPVVPPTGLAHRMEAHSSLRSHRGISSRMVPRSSGFGASRPALPPLVHLFLERNMNGSSTMSMAIVMPKAYAHTAIESTNCSLSGQIGRSAKHSGLHPGMILLKTLNAGEPPNGQNNTHNNCHQCPSQPPLALSPPLTPSNAATRPRAKNPVISIPTIPAMPCTTMMFCVSSSRSLTGVSCEHTSVLSTPKSGAIW